MFCISETGVIFHTMPETQNCKFRHALATKNGWRLTRTRLHTHTASENTTETRCGITIGNLQCTAAYCS